MAQEATYDWVAARFRDLSAGTLAPVDRERLRAIALSDPFVADALEGYETVSAADHASHLEQLATRISQARRPRRRWLIPNLTVTAIAATFMILIGTWAVIRWMTPAEESRLVILSTPEEVAKQIQDDTARETNSIADAATTPATDDPASRQTAEPESTGAITSSPPISARTKRTAPGEVLSSPAILQSPDQEDAQYALRAPVTPGPIRLTGRVTDVQGLSVPGARLSVLPSNLKINTDSTGAFETWLPPATLLASVTAPGFRPHEQSLPGSDSAITFILHPETPEETKVRLDQPGARRFPLDAWPTPSFDGFLEWLETNTRLPFTNQYRADSKYVTVSFSVTAHSSPGDVRVISTNAPLEYREEAVRLFSASPVWVCMQDGGRCQGVFTLCFD